MFNYRNKEERKEKSKKQKNDEDESLRMKMEKLDWNCQKKRIFLRTEYF